MLFTMSILFPLVLSVLLALAQALSSSGSHVLVVTEDAIEKTRFSQFWTDLQDRGYSLTFESPKNEKLSLFRHGERAYDHVILLPPRSKGLGPALTPNLLLQFINLDGNILLTLSADSPTPTAISSLLHELDIRLPSDRTSVVVDHYEHDVRSAIDQHDVLLLPRPSQLRSGARNFFAGDGVIAIPRAVPQELGNSSPLLTPILRAKKTAYSHNPKDDTEGLEDAFALGEQISLISCMQARNSARFTVYGSVEALEDNWFDAQVEDIAGKKSRTANRDFARQVSAWTFQEVGVLRVGRVEHHLKNEENDDSASHRTDQLGEVNPSIYRIKNDVTFDIEISEFSFDHLVPYRVDPEDALQVEFTMLSPFHRLDLTPTKQTPNSSIFSSNFKLPDQHGIFSFRVNHKRPFLTSVDEKREVTVRHFAHDEWPRSWQISAGWVWIAGIWITVGAWVAFVGIWLWSEPSYGGRKGEKTE